MFGGTGGGFFYSRLHVPKVIILNNMKIDSSLLLFLACVNHDYSKITNWRSYKNFTNHSKIILNKFSKIIFLTEKNHLSGTSTTLFVLFVQLFQRADGWGAQSMLCGKNTELQVFHTRAFSRESWPLSSEYIEWNFLQKNS